MFWLNQLGGFSFLSEISINNLELLRYSQMAIHGSIPDHIGDVFPAEKYTCFGEFREDGQALWVVSVYDFKKGHDCTMDIALNLSSGLFSRSLFEKIARVTCDYVFNQCELLRMTTFVRASNRRSYRITKRWGYVEEGLVRLGFGPPNPEDMVVFGMTRDECKWI